MADDGSGFDDDAVSGQVRGARELQAVTEGAERGIESADGLVGLGTDEQTGGADTEDVARAIVLALVDLAGDDVIGAAGRGAGAAGRPPRACRRQRRTAPLSYRHRRGE